MKIPLQKRLDNKLINYLVFIFLLNISLFDLYYYKIGRIFDYIGFFVLLLLNIYFYFSNKINVKKSIHDLRFKIIIFIYFFIPYLIYFDTRLGIGIAFFLSALILMLILFNSNTKILEIIVKQVPIILLIHLIFFYSQLILFKIFDIYVDFTSLFFSNASRNSHLFDGLFRPSGLFQEPNSFCLFTIIFMIILSCQNFFKINKIILFFSFFAILISNSLWGYLGAAMILFGLLIEKKLKYFILFFLISLMTQNIWLLNNTKIRINETTNDLISIFKIKKKIDNNNQKKVFQDPSGNERLFKVEVKNKVNNQEKFYNYDKNKINQLKTKCLEPFYNLFGCGYNNFGYQFIHGVNAFSFLKVNLGLFGFIYFIFGIILILKEKSYYNLMFIFYLFTTAPIFTYLIFSLFITIMFNKKIFDKTKKF